MKEEEEEEEEESSHASTSKPYRVLWGLRALLIVVFALMFWVGLWNLLDT